MFASLTAKLIAGAVLLALIVLAAALGPAACTSFFSAKQGERTAKGQAEAAIESGAEATNTVVNVMVADDATDRNVKEGIDEIRHAPEGDRGAAAERAVCRMRSYQHLERCAALRGSGPAGP